VGDADLAARQQARRAELWGIGYWETYPEAARGVERADWGGLWFDWNLSAGDWELEDSRGGVPVFSSGICCDYRRSLIEAVGGIPWARQLQDEYGFVLVHHADHDRLIRCAYPEEVLTGGELQTQGESLGRWIVATYNALHEAGPPPEAADGRFRPPDGEGPPE
jgi:hypothetical protein